MRTAGWGHHPFKATTWSKIAENMDALALQHPRYDHMASVAHSVLREGAADRLAGCTSMHDIIVVPTPIADPPYDVVAVRAPDSLSAPSDGHVRIEHLAHTGRHDRIERPVDGTLPLFWRFMIEKFGVRPDRDSLRPGTPRRANR